MSMDDCTVMLTERIWSTQRKICPSSPLSTAHPTWAGLDLNPGMCTDMPVINEISVNEGTGIFQVLLWIFMYVFDVQPLWRQNTCQMLDNTGLKNTEVSEWLSRMHDHLFYDQCTFSSMVIIVTESILMWTWCECQLGNKNYIQIFYSLV